MKVISIGTDRNIFKEGSAVRARVTEYGALFEEMHVVVFSKRSHGAHTQQIAPNVWVYPTRSLSRFLYIRDAVTHVRTICTNIGATPHNATITCEDPFACGVVGARVKSTTHIPLHIQIHTDFLSTFFAQESIFNVMRVRVARKVLRVADAVRVVSARIKESIERVHMTSVIPHVLPIFVDVQALQQASVERNLQATYPQFNFIILMASRLTREKNITLALHAFARLVTTYPKAGLVIVGEGPEKETLLQTVKHLNLSRNVVFEPWQQNLSSYYKTAHLFLVTSQYEGYGMTIIEALASGCPTISTDVGIAREVLTDGDVFVCPVGDASCLYEKIIACVENNALRETFIEEAILRLPNVTYVSKDDFLQKYKSSIESAHSTQ